MARGAAENGKARGSAYKLSRIAPPDLRIELRTKVEGEWKEREVSLSGDPDLTLAAQLMRVEGDATSSDSDAASAAMLEGKDLVLELIQERHPEVEEIRLGLTEFMAFCGLMLGGESAADGIAQAITAGMSDMQNGEIDQDDLLPSGEDDEADSGPLASKSRSSARSSSSGGSTARRTSRAVKATPGSPATGRR